MNKIEQRFQNAFIKAAGAAGLSEVEAKNLLEKAALNMAPGSDSWSSVSKAIGIKAGAPKQPKTPKYGFKNQYFTPATKTGEEKPVAFSLGQVARKKKVNYLDNKVACGDCGCGQSHEYHPHDEYKEHKKKKPVAQRVGEFMLGRKKEAFDKGFAKAAFAAGLNERQVIQLLKHAGPALPPNELPPIPPPPTAAGGIGGAAATGGQIGANLRKMAPSFLSPMAGAMNAVGGPKAMMGGVKSLISRFMPNSGGATNSPPPAPAPMAPPPPDVSTNPPVGMNSESVSGSGNFFQMMEQLKQQIAKQQPAPVQPGETNNTTQALQDFLNNAKAKAQGAGQSLGQLMASPQQ